MTSVAEVLAMAAERGVELRAVGDKLRFRARQGAMTPRLRSLIEATKSQLIDHLTPLDQLAADDNARRYEINAHISKAEWRSAENRKLAAASRQFLNSGWFGTAMALRWDDRSLFGIATNVDQAPIGTWGVVVTQALLLPGSIVEFLHADAAGLRKVDGSLCVWPRDNRRLSAARPWWV